MFFYKVGANTGGLCFFLFRNRDDLFPFCGYGVFSAFYLSFFLPKKMGKVLPIKVSFIC